MATSLYDMSVANYLQIVTKRKGSMSANNFASTMSLVLMCFSLQNKKPLSR